MKRGAIPPVEAYHKMLAADPYDHVGLERLGALQRESGDLEENLDAQQDSSESNVALGRLLIDARWPDTPLGALRARPRERPSAPQRAGDR